MSNTSGNFGKGIVIIPTEGLGNRFRIMACCYALAKYVGRPLFLVWEPEYNCNILISKLCTGDFTEISKDFIQGQKYLFFGHVHTQSFINQCFIDNKYQDIDYLIITGGHDFKLDDMPLETFLEYKSEFYKSLNLVPEIQTLFEKRRNQLTNEYISVHFRDIIGKYDDNDINNIHSNAIFNPIHFTNNSPLTAFGDFLKDIPLDVPIYISSNTCLCYDTLKCLFPERMFYTSGIDLTNLKRDNEADIINSFVDFLIMSHSKLIIGTYYSSFSDEASFLNRILKITPINPNLLTNPQIENEIMKYHCYGFSKVLRRGSYIYGLNQNYLHKYNSSIFMH